ncbi:MAG: ATP synthase F1 subunit gamma [Acidobacteria bacterium RIFCSPLOWO2_02_FULL_67_36]|nr:MAG: ATP synthase F1 subunit gamma [Acidobacteria bacterium RIFCSPLOWO2_02_FULL_67_36]OFW22923.1 MAG: ATP synthase F1 subunit gamma [Acidobacteria bacterium RIFCSPLOWO2_12_FULL_66_21]
MPSLLDIRRRIRAVKSTQQITKAMKMVAASRLRRAQERIQHARPFASEMLRVLNSLASRVDPSAHPLLDERAAPKAGGRVLMFVITADRGLCGSFNTNVIKSSGAFIAEHAGRQVALGLIGRRGRDFFARRGFDVRYEQINLFAALKFQDAQAIARTAMEAFVGGEVDSVYLVYNEFKSVMVQRVVVERLLPIPRGTFSEGTEPASAQPIVDYLYEPRPEDLFTTLLPSHVEVQVFRALLESAAAEHAARMTAMDAATRNSAEMIDQLTLYMNKVRQAAITREIIEVVSGAQAL